MLGDNLGLNGACGFVESFNSFRYCRICTATSDQCKIMSFEDETLLRTKENYEQDLQKNSLSTGIKERCIFNNLIDFHITENKCLDLMHDLCEGVVNYTLSKILTSLIFTEKIITLKTLNDRIQNFDYSVESSNKPRPIIRETSKKNKTDLVKDKIKLKQSAAEMLCLIRYLSLIIGDLIPEYNRYWKLYLTLRKIIAIATAPRFVLADVAELKILIRRHHEMYSNTFGPLKPKMHFLIHLPALMLNNGPAIHFWAMPFERKNKELKDVAVSVSSYRNLPLTIGIRCQLEMCYTKEYCNNMKTQISFGPVENESDAGISPFLSSVNYATSYKFVDVCGKCYSEGSVIIIKFTDDGSKFAIVKKIYEACGKAYVLVSEITSIYFKEHYYAYKVNLAEKSTVLLDLSELPKVDPCVLVQVESSYYIATRYD